LRLRESTGMVWQAGAAAYMMGCCDAPGLLKTWMAWLEDRKGGVSDGARPGWNGGTWR